MKQYIGIIIILIGVICLIAHAFSGGNITLWIGLILEIVGFVSYIFINKQRKY
ncbi:MAG: hypothetical protein MJ001_04635 [Paludibacteraceae bacterium]|nr:hypothetical protein [Candidatus Colousia faecequi]MCQ2338193.1 hypothetical protein [Paludibacteraceae bacterium]